MSSHHKRNRINFFTVWFKQIKTIFKLFSIFYAIFVVACTSLLYTLYNSRSIRNTLNVLAIVFFLGQRDALCNRYFCRQAMIFNFAPITRNLFCRLQNRNNLLKTTNISYSFFPHRIPIYIDEHAPRPCFIYSKRRKTKRTKTEKILFRTMTRSIFCVCNGTITH